MSDYFFPRLQAVEALQPYRLRTVWSTGEVLELDVGERLKKHQALKPLLQPEMFAKVHVSEWGGGIEWLDEEFGADNVYAWAKEQAGEASHEMLDDWMTRNHLSLSTAADALGRTTLPRVNRAADDFSRASRNLSNMASRIGDNPQSVIYGPGAGLPGPGEPGFVAPNAAH